jgi:hypothetical protein
MLDLMKRLGIVDDAVRLRNPGVLTSRARLLAGAGLLIGMPIAAVGDSRAGGHRLRSANDHDYPDLSDASVQPRTSNASGRREAPGRPPSAFIDLGVCAAYSGPPADLTKPLER